MKIFARDFCKTDARGREMAPIFFLLLHLCLCRASYLETGHSGDEISLTPVNESQRVFRLNRKSKPWLDGRDQQCIKESKCEKLRFKHCLGSKLPYNETSLELAHSYSQEQVQERLQQYVALKNIPKCWAVIQPMLCATFMPKCESIEDKSRSTKQDYVHLPSLEMCRIVMEPCKLVYDTSIFPDFLKCNNSLLYSKCDNNVREIKFNLSGTCLAPLVHTDVSSHFYEGMTTCGLPCQDPLYTKDEHNQIGRLILWSSTLSLILSLFTVCTFLIDWRSSCKYPALVIFYIAVCYVISSLGWLSQFIFDSRDDIVCSKDGTRRKSEPSAGENLSCVTIFVLVYYFLIAACVWFVIFTYAWHMSFKALGKIQERIDKKGAYFHLVAWSFPLVLTIATMALGEIDGSSITGICFVGYLNHPIRAGFLLGPLLATLIIGGFFLSRGIITLISVRTSSKDIISVRASSKIHSTIMRGAVTAILVLIFISITFVSHVYEFANSKLWYNSFRTYLICKLTTLYHGSWDLSECVQSSRPSVAMLQLQLLCQFFSVCLMTSWVFTTATLQTWKRYIRMKCGFETEEPTKLQKHKLIAQAFARRKEFHKKGRMSISFHNTFTDPVGLNFELNSMASHDFSSTWANNLPRFVERRGALTGAPNSHSQSSSAPRRNSQDSQISFSLRHVSVESRRNSLDSQVSVKIAEMKTKVASRRRVKPHKSSKRRIQRNSGSYARKESTTSIESQIGAHFVSAVSTTRERRLPNLSHLSNRRVAAGGLNRDQINLLLANGKAILPFLQNQNLTTSDEENGSTASFKICDSQLNIVLRRRDTNGSTDENNRLAITGYNDSDSDTKNIEMDNLKYDSESSEEIVEKHSRKEHKEVCGSKSSSKSKSSRKSSRQSGRVKRPMKSKGSKVNTRLRDDSKGINSRIKAIEMNADASNVKNSLDSSLDSYCIELGRLAIQSSYSGVSVGKNNSRNSKTSCDVGIQANSHEIANQTLSSTESNLSVKKKSNTKPALDSVSAKKSGKHDKKQKETKNRNPDKSRQGEMDNEDCAEPLLKNSGGPKAIIVKKKVDRLNINESKKLKQLLLPSTK